MAFNKIFIFSGLLLVTITTFVQSAPIEKTIQSSSLNNKESINQDLVKSIVDSEKTSSISTTTTTSTISESASSIAEKKKRFIDVNLLDESSESDEDQTTNIDNNDHIMHANMQETSAKIHDNTDKIFDTDDSKIFSDFKMTPNDLTNVIRRRREIKLNDQTNQRHKRSLSFYDTDSFYEPYDDLFEQEQYDRPTRSFAPIYWYPTGFERTIRSKQQLPSTFYESSTWPRSYLKTIDEDESDENPTLIYDVDSNENDYELNRYPILSPSANLALNNFELQQKYNTDDLPYNEYFGRNDDDDDDDEEDEDSDAYAVFTQKSRPFYTNYGPIEAYI